MAGPEIVMQTPAAKQLELAVQKKLAEFSYSTADDVVMAEYVVVMLANSKTPEQITAELTELIGEDMYDTAFTDWLFEEVARQYGVSSSRGAVPRSPEEIPEQSSLSARKSPDPTPRDVGGKIETVRDSRDNHPRGTLKRPGNGMNTMRSAPGVFGQALGGLKRPGANEIHRDTPPHRRMRADDMHPGASTPSGPRFMDRNLRDSSRQNHSGHHLPTGPPHIRRDTHNGFSPHLGHALGAESAGRSILERVGMLNGNRPFPGPGYPGVYDHRGGHASGQLRRGNEPLREGLSNGRPHTSLPQAHPVFYGAVGPYPNPMGPNNSFPQQPFHPSNIMSSATPQLFLANGQPFIPTHPFQISGSPAGVPHATMYPPMLLNAAPNSSGQPNLAQTGRPSPLPGKVSASPAAGQPSAAALAALPSKPLLKQECKYNLLCKNAWCPSSHCSPKGTAKTSMLLSFDPCDKQLECSDPDCSKAHVSPQQREPKASIRPPATTSKPATLLSAAAPPFSPAPSLAASSSSMACRFGINCARPDCAFAHPWKVKGPANTAGTLPDRDSFKNGLAAIPCKFGVACTRPACHFQHPPRSMSKNISKTFNNSDSIPSGALGSSNLEKLTPSKKFRPSAVAPQAEPAVDMATTATDLRKADVKDADPSIHSAVQHAALSSAPPVTAS